MGLSLLKNVYILPEIIRYLWSKLKFFSPIWEFLTLMLKTPYWKFTQNRTEIHKKIILCHATPPSHITMYYSCTEKLNQTYCKTQA